MVHAKNVPMPICSMRYTASFMWMMRYSSSSTRIALSCGMKWPMRVMRSTESRFQYCFESCHVRLRTSGTRIIGSVASRLM